MKPLTHLLDQLLSRAQADWQIKLRAEWSTIMGDLSRRARLERINDTTVVIGVYDSHWMHELHALSRMMLQRINSALSSVYPPGFTLKSVRCIWVHQKVFHKKNNSPLHAEVKKIKPSTQAIHHAEKLPTADLKDAMIAYYIRCKQEKNEQ
jgi:hypothetical protein